MLRSRLVAAALAALALAATPAAAQTTATQVVNFEVQAINQISVGGAPGLLSVSTATTGQAPNSVSTTGAWSVTTNAAAKKLTAQINLAMPTGLTLKANLAAPSGAASTGATTLGTSAVDVVTGIAGVSASSLAITYTLDATAAAAPTSSTPRTITYTLADAP